jgi:hypothetical protein
MEDKDKIINKKSNLITRNIILEKIVQIKTIKKKDIKKDINHYLKKTLKNTLSAFFLSLIYTIINFLCNIPLLRYVTKESYGIVKVHFELAFTLVNYIPRETIRRSSQKFSPDKEPKKEKEKYIRISQINYLFFFCMLFVSIFIFCCFMLFTNSIGLKENYIQLLLYILCGLIELIVEPVVMYMNLHMENKFLPITISSISRVITNTIFVVIFNMDLWGFTLSRIVGTTVYLGYILSLGIFKYELNFYEFIPKDYKTLIFERTTNNRIDISYLREIIYQFIKLNLLNFILSRCQNIVLSFIIKSAEEEKSDYYFISQNYGLITRFLFDPIIDAFYNLVNKIKHIKKKDEKLTEENIYKKNINNNNNSIKFSNTIINNQVPYILEENNLNEIKIKQIKEQNKEINYELTIKLLQIFLKIFSFLGILIIPYYLLIGTEIMGLIYGPKWQTNTIDKIGDCYSYYIIITAVSDLIKNFGNATNDTRQMNLSYISLILNALFLSLIMYFLSKWDICGLIISNQLSAIFLINFNLYIIFCGKSIKNNNIVLRKGSIYNDIKYFIKKCFLSSNSIIISLLSIIISFIIKKLILIYNSTIKKIFYISFIGFINVLFIYVFDYKIIMEDLNNIKSYN